MAHRRSSLSRISSFESLEPRNLMSAITTIPTNDTSAEVRNLLHPSADLSPEAQWAKGEGEGSRVEAEMQPHEVFSSDQKQEFWEDIPEGKDLVINDRVQAISRGEVLPTPESPVIFKTQFTLGGKKSGITLITRTDGVTSGRFNNEFRNGLSFRAEYNVACIYFSDPVGGALIGIPVEFPERLQLGVPYDFLVEDRGTEAHLVLSQGDKVLADIRGAIPRAASEPRTVLRRTETTDAYQVHISGTSLSHGMEPAQKPTAQSPQEALPEEHVDAVFADLAFLQSLLDREDALQEEADDTVYSTDASGGTFGDFWQDANPDEPLSINDRKQLVSRMDMEPTEQNPLVVHTQFTMNGKKGGIMFVTRTDGVSSGRFDNEYEEGLSFHLSYNSASLWYSSGAHQGYIGEPLNFTEHLALGVTYDVTVEDRGSQARFVISQNGTVIGEIQGALPVAAQEKKYVARRVDASSVYQVDIGSMEIRHANPVEASTTQKKAGIEKDDPRLALIKNVQYGAPLASFERSRLFLESRFFISTEMQNALPLRNPAYGGGNHRVDSDIRTELGRLLGVYQDVVGDALQRGMEYHIADLKGEPTQHAMEMLDFVLGTRTRGRYIGELARDFQVYVPNKQAVLAESQRLLNGNIDRLIENQKAVERQNWEDTHLGDTPRKEKDPKESRQVEVNKDRLKEAMVKTAPKIQNLGAEVRREFEAAVAKSPFSLQEIYAEARVPYLQVVSRENHAEAGTPDSEVLGKSSFSHEAAPGATVVIKNGELIGSESIRVPAESSQTMRFALDREVMANFWVNSVPGRAVSLTISGGDLPAGGYSSDHGNSSAGSTSLKLTPGTYEVTVSDKTNYGVMPHGNDLRSRPLEFPLHMDVRPWNMREIVGRVSLPGESEVKEVSLRVAEFDPSGQRKTDYKATEGNDAISALNPSLPVWVGVHGRNDNENSDQMSELEQSLLSNNVQLVTLNWAASAKDNMTKISLDGSKWIESVGAWAANQLQSMEIPSANISGVGHSWGSYVVYEIGAHLPGGLRTIVALDPAEDNIVLADKYDNSKVNFASVADSSYAFHSSMFGDARNALTAQKTFSIQVPENYEGNDIESLRALLEQKYFVSMTNEVKDELLDAWREHGFAVTLFSELLQNAKDNPSHPIASLFTPQKINSGTSPLAECNEEFEGIFYVNPTKSKYTEGESAGQDWWKAEQYYFDGRTSAGNPIQG